MGKLTDQHTTSGIHHMIKHQEVHPNLSEPGCFGCRIASVRIGAAAMPTRHERVNTMTTAWDKQMKDDAAYIRLVKNGLHPARTAGCAELENCDDKRFIEGTPELWDRRGEILADLSDTPQVKVES